MSSIVYWQSVSFSSLQIEEWYEEYTVFQPDSGKTHFLNKMGLQIILCLDQSPASEDEVCQMIAEQFQLIPDQNFSRHVIKTLHRFDALGLVEKVKLESLV